MGNLATLLSVTAFDMAQLPVAVVMQLSTSDLLPQTLRPIAMTSLPRSDAMTRLFSDLGFRWKITLPISALAILLVLMGAVGMRGIERVADSSELLATRHLPAIGLLLNADRDLYQAFVAERSLLDSDAGAHAQALKASHAENLKQAYDRVQKYAAMQPAATRWPWSSSSTAVSSNGRRCPSV